MVDQILPGQNADPNTLTAVGNEVYFYAFQQSPAKRCKPLPHVWHRRRDTSNHAGHRERSRDVVGAEHGGCERHTFFTSLQGTCNYGRSIRPDGSAVNASPFAWIPPLSTDLTAVNGQLYFIADSSYTSGPEI